MPVIFAPALLTMSEMAAAAAVAEAAAVAAAQAAAAQAAAATAAEAVIAPALTEAAIAPALTEAVAPLAAEATGILGATPEAAGILGATPPPGAEQVLGQAAMPLPPAGTTPLPPAGIEQIGAQGFSPAELEAVLGGQADAAAAQGTGVQSAGINNIGYTPSAAQTSSGIGINPGVNPSVPGPFDTGYKPLIQGGNPAYPSTMGQLQPGVTAPIAPSAPVTPPTSNSFMQGFEQFAKDNPLTTAAGAYSLASATGMLKPTSGEIETKEKKQYGGPRLSANFQGGPYSEPNVYEEKQYNYASGGIIEAYQSGGPVERMSQMNTAMNPQGGLYPQGMIDKTQYATPTQRPVSAELMMDAPAYERSNPMLMAEGGEVKGYAAGGMPDLGPGFSFGDIKPYTATQAEEQAAIAANQAAGIKTIGNVASQPANNLGQFGDPRSGGNNLNMIRETNLPIIQPTGQSMYPGAASMQGGFGQGAQGYPSFAGGSGGGSSGPFPLEGQYGIIKMAAGGIASIPRYNNGRLATSSNKRKDTYSATQRFLDMYDPQSRYAASQEASDPRVGIFRDTTASTRNKSAFDAAMTRQAALEEQNYVDTGANLPRASRAMGQLNLKPQGKKAQKREEYDYARGGITQASLGGYAAGGNPRLLKGPGDGMSDNIPAVIGNRQPARLADGEFVVPADVVSHLGNGSTDAGAKKLHGMMDNVRKARTGKKKQAPAVKTNKFIPK